VSTSSLLPCFRSLRMSTRTSSAQLQAITTLCFGFIVQPYHTVSHGARTHVICLQVSKQAVLLATLLVQHLISPLDHGSFNCKTILQLTFQ
jgi:hypothetical protein